MQTSKYMNKMTKKAKAFKVWAPTDTEGDFRYPRRVNISYSVDGPSKSAREKVSVKSFQRVAFNPCLNWRCPFLYLMAGIPDVTNK